MLVASWPTLEHEVWHIKCEQQAGQLGVVNVPVGDLTLCFLLWHVNCKTDVILDQLPWPSSLQCEPQEGNTFGIS